MFSKIQSNKINSLTLIKLIIFCFLFSFPSTHPLEWSKHESEKFSQIETSADYAVLKTTSEAKLLKRIPFLENIINVRDTYLVISSYSLDKLFFDFNINIQAFELHSSLARAPPIA